MSNELSATVDLYRLALSDLLAAAEALSTEDLERPTLCEGWTVRDQVAHVVGLEQSQSGSPEPTIALPEYDYVQSDFGRVMERQVEARRNLPFNAVRDEFRSLLPRRFEQLAGQLAQGDPEIPNPLGAPAMLSSVLPIRILDLFGHRLDIARALNQPAPTSGEVADFVMAMTLRMYRGILPQRIAGHGSVLIATTAPHNDEITIDLDRSYQGNEPAPQASITLSRDSYFKLCMGRGDIAASIADAGLEGDAELLEAVAQNLSITP